MAPEQLTSGLKVPQEGAAPEHELPELAGARQQLPALEQQGPSAQQAAPAANEGGQEG